MLKKIKRLLTDKDYRFLFFSSKSFFKKMDDATYLKKMYHAQIGKQLNLKNPKTFNEKIQWIKLNDRNPQYTDMVDKFEAKKYVSKIIGEKHIIPTLGVWNKFDEIDFDKLPEQFVLKCTHDSGGLVICRDKATLDRVAAKRKIEKSLKNKFYYKFREWAYKDVKPRIIAERYMEDTNSFTLRDYKFFCFHGKAEFLYVSEGLEDHATAKISFFDFTGKQLPFHRKDYAPFLADLTLPATLDGMKEIAEEIASSIGNEFSRIDLYSINDEIYFSEITLYPNGGFIPFAPEEWDEKIGAMLKLKNI